MQRIVFFTLATIAMAFACGTNEKTCNNGQCYNPTTTVCLQDVDKSYSLCPTGLQICNKACFNPSSYYCDSNGNLQSGQAPAAKTSAATKASTTSAAAAKASTTSAAAAKSTTKSTTSTTKAATTSAAAATPATSSAAAATPVTSSSAASSGSNTCAKASYCDPAACACNGACYSPSAYCCDGGTTLKQAGQCSNSGAASTSAAAASTTAAAATPATSSAAAATPATSSSAASSGSNTCAKASYCDPAACACNGACYSPSAYCCDAGTTLKQAGQCSNSGAASTSSTTSSAAKVATTTATPVVNPTPVAGNGFPTQNADLRIINNCKTTLWLEARYGNQGAPLPGQSTTAVQALPGSYVDYTVPDTGLSGSRFWAKYGCDTNGKNCLIGDQMQYWPNPPGGCPSGGCTPPVDSLFEATWGCRPGSSCNSQNPTTWFDTSQVDGWTIPYKLTPVGDTSGCDCIGSSCGFKGVDASTLDLKNCPSGEDLTANGAYPYVNAAGKNTSLSSVDLRIINNGQVLGCMSPCKRLNWGVPYGLQQDEGHGSAMWMCCPTPTPDNCSPSNGCITPQACRTGPIENTQFVAAVHRMAPGVYSYSYDDGVGLHACPAGVTKYTMEFCPAGSAAYPGTA